MEISPRFDERSYYVMRVQTDSFSRLINGRQYAFSRLAYDDGTVRIQVYGADPARDHDIVLQSR